MNAKQPLFGNVVAEYKELQRQVLKLVYAEKEVPEATLKEFEAAAKALSRSEPAMRPHGILDPDRATKWVKWKRTHRGRHKQRRSFQQHWDFRLPARLERWRCQFGIPDQSGAIAGGNFLGAQQSEAISSLGLPYSQLTLDPAMGPKGWLGSGGQNEPQFLTWISCDAQKKGTILRAAFETVFDLPGDGPYLLTVRSKLFTDIADGRLLAVNTTLVATHGLYVRVPVPPNPPDEGMDGNSFSEVWRVWDTSSGWNPGGPVPHVTEEVRLRARGPGLVTAIESVTYSLQITQTDLNGSALYFLGGSFNPLEWETRSGLCPNPLFF